MFIRYHLFYYAIACLLAVMGHYFHVIFYMFLLGYLLWILRHNGLRIFIVMIAFVIVVLRPMLLQQEDIEQIEGRVIKTSEKYCYVKTDIGIFKLYYDEKLNYNDEIGAAIELLEMNENTNDNAFNEKLYLYGQNVFYKGQITQLNQKEHHNSFYQWLENHFSSNTDINDYQRLFLLGERSADIQDDYQQLSQLSLVHLFALSGMHIHILCILLKKIFGIIFNQKLAAWLSYLCIGIYVFSIPMQISLYRAFFVLVLYEIFKKWFHELDVLSFLVIVSLIYNPYIIYNISFVFSYFIYFIVILTKRLPHSSMLIYLASVPIVLTLNYQIPLTAFLVGYIMTPFIELLYCLCCFSVFIPFVEMMLEGCIHILKLMIDFLQYLDAFWILSKPTLSFIIMFYILYFKMLYQLELKKKIDPYISMMIAFFIMFSFYSQYKIYGEVTMIDVGQGDCTLIRLPMNQGNILIDTGGNKDFDLATKTIIPYLKSIGIHRLDFVYISHGDFDHCGALESLQDNFHVGKVIEDYEEYREIGMAKVRMLKPEHVYTDINDQSLIMEVELMDCSLLFMGDASAEVENDLKNKYQSLDIDILKVSHHGSKTSSSPQLFEFIKPDIAMIGVKLNNMYHHPSSEVIERLNRKGIKILRTDEDGMFHIRFYGKSRYIFR